MLASATLAAGCSSGGNTGDTTVARRELYRVDHVKYDEFFEDVFEIQKQAALGREEEKKAREALTTALGEGESSGDALASVAAERAKKMALGRPKIVLALEGVEANGALTQGRRLRDRHLSGHAPRVLRVQMRASRPFLTQPEPVGTFPTDCSPYGVRDLAGNVREWVGDIAGELTWEQASSEPEPTANRGGKSIYRVFRSGNWASSAENCRAASRTRFPALARYATLSFRVAISLSPRST